MKKAEEKKIGFICTCFYFYFIKTQKSPHFLAASLPVKSIPDLRSSLDVRGVRLSLKLNNFGFSPENQIVDIRTVGSWKKPEKELTKRGYQFDRQKKG